MKVFLLIVIASLGCAALGGGFGWLVGALSPEFITLIAFSPVVDSERLGAAMGLVSGLFLGAGAMGFGLLVEALRAWATRGRARTEPLLDQTLHTGNHVEEGSSSYHVRPA